MLVDQIWTPMKNRETGAVDDNFAKTIAPMIMTKLLPDLLKLDKDEDDGDDDVDGKKKKAVK